MGSFSFINFYSLCVAVKFLSCKIVRPLHLWLLCKSVIDLKKDVDNTVCNLKQTNKKKIKKTETP